MKLSFGLFVAAASIIGANALKANSEMGKNILSQARRLEQENEADDAMMWVADYSLKFQGCHHVYQWNEEVDEDQDVRLYAKRLARFRLCPSDDCSTSLSGGCTSGYGDYVIDMATYVNAYYETFQQQLEEECQNFQQNMCANCEGNDDENGCYYNCFVEAEMEQCSDFLEDEDGDGDDFQVEAYLECAQWNPPDNDERKRRLEDGEEEVEYFIGPYCSGQGGSVKMGLFTDDTCTTFADEEGGAYTYEQLSGGYSLPFSSDSIVGEECFSCVEPNYEQQDEDNDDEAEVEINEACQVAYMGSGKCEYMLEEGVVQYPENSACNYIDGIKIIREDGMVLIKPEHPNAVATAFIVVSAMAFAAMGFYVWYLRTRLGIKSNSLL